MEIHKEFVPRNVSTGAMTQQGRKNYTLLGGYCYKLVGAPYRDLLHDAYLTWYKKNGTNLFEQPNYVGAKVIRNVFMNWSRATKYMWRGGIYPRIFHEAVGEREYGTTAVAPLTNITPHDHTFWEMNLKPAIGAELGMVLEGYSINEIAATTRRSPQLTSYYVQKNKKKLAKIINPIAGSRVTLLTKLSKKQFEVLSDRDEYKKTGEGNETVDIYVKDIDTYEATGTTDGILVKLTKD